MRARAAGWVAGVLAAALIGSGGGCGRSVCAAGLDEADAAQRWAEPGLAKGQPQHLPLHPDPSTSDAFVENVGGAVHEDEGAQGDDTSHGDGSMQAFQTNALSLSAGNLDFGEVELGEPAVQTLLLRYEAARGERGARPHRAVELVGWEATDPQVQVPMFSRRILRAGEQVQVLVSLSPWRLGVLESALFLTTSEGRFLVRVRANAVASRFRLQPLVGARIGTHVVWRPALEIYNPDPNTALEITQVFTTEGYLHLRIDEGANWTVPPLQTRQLARISFQSPVPGIYRGFVRIKLAGKSQPQLLIPVDVEVLPGAVLADPSEISFGTLVRQNASSPFTLPGPRAVQLLGLHNYGPISVEISDISAVVYRTAPLPYGVLGRDSIALSAKQLPSQLEPRAWNPDAVRVALTEVAEMDGELRGEIVVRFAAASQQDRSSQQLPQSPPLLPVRVPIKASLRTGSIETRPAMYLIRYPDPKEPQPMQTWNAFAEPIVILGVHIVDALEMLQDKDLFESYRQHDEDRVDGSGFHKDPFSSPCHGPLAADRVDSQFAWFRFKDEWDPSRLVGTVVAAGEPLPEIPLLAARVNDLSRDDVHCRSRADKTRAVVIETNVTRLQVPVHLYHGRVRASAVRLPDMSVLTPGSWDRIDIRLGSCALDSRTQVRLYLSNENAVPIHVRRLEQIDAGSSDSVVRLSQGASFPETLKPYAVDHVDLDILLHREFLAPGTMHVAETWILRTSQGFAMSIVIEADIVPGDLLLSLPAPIEVTEVVLGDEARFGPVEIESTFNVSVAVEWDQMNDPRVHLTGLHRLTLAPFSTTSLGDLVIDMSRCTERKGEAYLGDATCESLLQQCAEAPGQSQLVHFRPEVFVVSNLTGLRFALPVRVDRVQCPKLPATDLHFASTMIGARRARRLRVYNPSRQRPMEARLDSITVPKGSALCRGEKKPLPFSLAANASSEAFVIPPQGFADLGPIYFSPRAVHARDGSLSATVRLETNLTGPISIPLTGQGIIAPLHMSLVRKANESALSAVPRVTNPLSDALDAESCETLHVAMQACDESPCTQDFTVGQVSKNSIGLHTVQQAILWSSGKEEISLASVRVQSRTPTLLARARNEGVFPRRLKPGNSITFDLELTMDCSVAHAGGVVEVAVNKEQMHTFGVALAINKDLLAECRATQHRLYWEGTSRWMQSSLENTWFVRIALLAVFLAVFSVLPKRYYSPEGLKTPAAPAPAKLKEEEEGKKEEEEEEKDIASISVVATKAQKPLPADSGQSAMELKENAPSQANANGLESCKDDGPIAQQEDSVTVIERDMIAQTKEEVSGDEHIAPKNSKDHLSTPDSRSSRKSFSGSVHSTPVKLLRPEDICLRASPDGRSDALATPLSHASDGSVFSFASDHVADSRAGDDLSLSHGPGDEAGLQAGDMARGASRAKGPSSAVLEAPSLRRRDNKSAQASANGPKSHAASEGKKWPSPSVPTGNTRARTRSRGRLGVSGGGDDAGVRRPLQAPWKKSQAPTHAEHAEHFEDSTRLASRLSGRPPLAPSFTPNHRTGGDTGGGGDSDRGRGNAWNKASLSPSALHGSSGGAEDASWRRRPRRPSLGRGNGRATKSSLAHGNTKSLEHALHDVTPSREHESDATPSRRPERTKYRGLNTMGSAESSRSLGSTSSSDSSTGALSQGLPKDQESSPSLGPASFFGPQLLPSFRMDTSAPTDPFGTTSYFLPSNASPRGNAGGGDHKEDDRLGLPDFSSAEKHDDRLGLPDFSSVARDVTPWSSLSQPVLPPPPMPPPGMENFTPRRDHVRLSSDDEASATLTEPAHRGNDEEEEDEPFGILRALSLQ